MADMFTYQQLTALLFNTPIAAHPDKLPMLIDAVSGRTGIAIDDSWRLEAEARINRMPIGARMAMRGPAKSQRGGSANPPPYSRIDDIAVIPIHGTLINRGAFIGAYSGVTSYEGVKFQLRHAGADPETRAVILDIDSPGGQAAGAFEAAAAVRELAAQKTVVAVVDDMAASAAYAIASAATRIFVTPSGMVGSIGVVMLHLDHSKRLENAGVVPTLIHAGSHKVDANPFQKLPDGVREDLQAEVDAAQDKFVECVATGRKNLTPAAIRATEARTYIGTDAVAAGLVDEVGTMETVLEAFATARLARNVLQNPHLVSFTQADLDRARAEGRAEGMQLSVSDGGLAAAMARIDAMVSLPEAQGRQQYARHLASQTAISIEAAKEVLKHVATEADVIRAGGSPLGLVATIVGKPEDVRTKI
jgi:signal peptide peptidase SppA